MQNQGFWHFRLSLFPAQPSWPTTSNIQTRFHFGIATESWKQHQCLFLFFRKGDVSSMKIVLSFTEIFITIKALTNIIVIILISLSLPSTTYLTFKWDFSHIFMCWTKTPTLPLKKMTKKWQKRAKSAFSNELLGEHFSENCGYRRSAPHRSSARPLREAALRGAALRAVQLKLWKWCAIPLRIC